MTTGGNGKEVLRISNEKEFCVDYFHIIPMGNLDVYAYVVNRNLKRNRRPERWRGILFEDRIVGEGIWSAAEAQHLAQSITMGEDGNYHLPSSRYREEHSDENSMISFQVDSDAVRVLTENHVLEPAQGSTTDYTIKLPEKLKLAENTGINMKVVLGEEPAEEGKIWFTLLFTRS